MHCSIYIIILYKDEIHRGYTYNLHYTIMAITRPPPAFYIFIIIINVKVFRGPSSACLTRARGVVALRLCAAVPI